MKEKLIYWLTYAWKVFTYSRFLILWNLFLAFIPLVLSLWLFRLSRSRSLIWWALFLVFVAFLPNAPYVLTDTIHLIDLIREVDSIWIIVLVLIPQYVIFVLAGFEAYVISLINLGYYLDNQGKKKYILGMELMAHALSAVGIYLGRFLRFNSWDFVSQPSHLARSIFEDLTNKEPIIVIVVTFFVLTILYWLTKQLTLGISLRMRYRQ